MRLKPTFGETSAKAAEPERACPRLDPRVRRLQAALDDRGDAAVQSWWEGYLKGVIPFRGVRMAGVRAVLEEWLEREGLWAAVPATRRDAAFELFAGEAAEDKLAGILMLAEHLLPQGEVGVGELDRLAGLFDAGRIRDWNVCDWLCVKVLGPLVEAEGEPAALAIGAWRSAENVWRARASAVAFVHLVRRGDGFFPGFVDLVLASSAALLARPERFAHTGAGWLLRELEPAAPERTRAFLAGHLGEVSAEALRAATERMPAPERRAWRMRRRSARGAGPAGSALRLSPPAQPSVGPA